MSLEDELDGVVERYELASRYERFPMEVDIEYEHSEYGYVIRIQTEISGERRRTGVVIPEDTNVERIEQVLENAMSRLRDHLWREYVVEVGE